MTLTEILDRFHLLCGDDSELSTTEEESIANQEYLNIAADIPWEILKKTATGTLSTSVPYVSLPTDFGSLTENNQETSNTANYADLGPKVIFLVNGSTYTPYKVVNWSDRRQYVNEDVFYIDIVNSRLYCAKQPTTASSYEFDYVSIPTTLTSAQSPVFPSRFHEAIAYKMATRNDIQQRMEKARSNAAENLAFYKQMIDSMKLWNANLRND